jgi:hypothetical protein
MASMAAVSTTQSQYHVSHAATLGNLVKTPEPSQSEAMAALAREHPIIAKEYRFMARIGE